MTRDVGAESSEKGKGLRNEEQLNKSEKFFYAQFSVLNKVTQTKSNDFQA